MNTLIVVNESSHCRLSYPHATVVAAQDYLTRPCFREAAHVTNLCRPLDYQGVGYYVSLLAEARGQHPFPSLRSIDSLPCSERHGIPDRHVVKRRTAARQAAIAILCEPGAQEPPSSDAAIEQFCLAARALDMRPQVIAPDEIDRLAEFDALFIRATTNVNHYTYRFSCRAADMGLTVIDDPDSILKCNNKVFLAELFDLHHIPAPKTMLVHAGNIDAVIPALGLPCILKQPDGAFSLGVVKAETAEQLHRLADGLLQKSALILAQEFLPTDFDWRIGILDGQPLFACQYFMAPGHWQIIKRQLDVKLSEGKACAVPLHRVPRPILDSAVAAASLIGNGLYGVDLKQVGRRACVIEINDNPNVDRGNEDGILGDALYRNIMQVFRQRIDADAELRA